MTKIHSSRLLGLHNNLFFFFKRKKNLRTLVLILNFVLSWNYKKSRWKGTMILELGLVPKSVVTWSAAQLT